MSKRRIETDVLIVGGGLVGTLLANTLLRIPVRVTMIEAQEPGRLEQPSFDGRVTALANGSQRVLEQLGLWPALAIDAQSIGHIHIGEQGCFGAARIDAVDEGVPALGYTVENRVIGAALWASLAGASSFETLAPARLASFSADDRGVTAEAVMGGETIDIDARLLVAADGTRSSVRQSLGIAAREDDYGQQAVIVNCATEIPHRGRAYERFTPSGPLAVLPLTRNRVAVVWTLEAAAADEVSALADTAFRDALQAAFGYRLGRILRVGQRATHPLWRLRADALTNRRCVLIGNAAVSLHPVAGQGFNLAVRDTAALAELIAQASADGSKADGSRGGDIGDDAVLDAYRQWRASDQRKLARFTHGLIRLFGMQAPGLGIVRGLGLMTFDLLPGAKSLLALHTMGRAGRLPRLARGLDLH